MIVEDINELFPLLCVLLIIMFMGCVGKSFSFNNISQEKPIDTTFISNDYFDEIKNIESNKNVIMDELVEIIGSGDWKIFKSERCDDTKISDCDNILSTDKCSEIGIEYKMFELIANKKLNETNLQKFQGTYHLIKNIPDIINASFLCLEPCTKITYQSNLNRIFISIIGSPTNTNSINCNQIMNETEQHVVVLSLDMNK